jgi:ankyrin repeat protein
MPIPYLLNPITIPTNPEQELEIITNILNFCLSASTYEITNLTITSKTLILNLLVKHKDIEIVKLSNVLKLFVNIRHENMPIIHWAIMHDYMDLFHLLLENGADLEARNQIEGTVLTYACYTGHIAVAEMLIDKGANIEAKDGSGSTALISACYMGHIAVVEMLLDKGANIDAENKYGDTALSLANNPIIIEILEQQALTSSSCEPEYSPLETKKRM